jgi:hypothetical protein
MMSACAHRWHLPACSLECSFLLVVNPVIVLLRLLMFIICGEEIGGRDGKAN